MPKKNSESSKSSKTESPISLTPINSKKMDGDTITKTGWLQKWTNYLKGYRQRWFVLDSNGNFAYYRNQTEVGLTSRGSINLQESRIHSDSRTNSLIISTISQSFHLKAQNEVDRLQWLTALEYARHNALKRAEDSEDEKNEIFNQEDSEISVIFESKKEKNISKQIKNEMNLKLEQIKKSRLKIDKYSNKIKLVMGEKSRDEKQFNEAAEKLKKFIDKLIKNSDDLIELVVKDYQNLSRFASNEHEQRIQLREQLETLARQHRNLETMAFQSNNSINNNHNNTNLIFKEQSPYYDDDDEDNEVFHDAADDFEAQIKTKDNLKNPDEISRKSSTSQNNYKQQNDVNEESMNNEIFNTEIVVSKNMPFEMTEIEKQNSKENNNFKNDGDSDDGNNERIIIELPPQIKHTNRQRRDLIPNRLQASISLWSIMRNSIGKDLSRIAMPVNFNEPLSTCQRITEDLEYAYLLDRAAEKMNTCEQMCYVAAYAISSYSTTGNRTTKPFNPILGETYECDRTEDLGWKSLTEQVSHHPPSTAHHAEGRHWEMYQEISILSRFRGKYLSVTPQGHTHVIIKSPNLDAHYTYKKVTTTVHNIIVGKLWIDNYGEMHIENHNTGDKCIIKFHAYSYFSSEKPKRINGIVKDKHGNVKYLLQGYWDKHIDLLQVTKHQKSVLETLAPRRIWTINPTYKNSDKMYYFTKLAVELNEPEPNVAPTDSRLREDQRLMENGKWDEANKRKNELEEKQRLARKQRTLEIEKAMQAGLAYPEYKANWFEKQQDELTGSVIHVFNGDYWKCKKVQDWSRCPDIY